MKGYDIRQYSISNLGVFFYEDYNNYYNVLLYLPIVSRHSLSQIKLQDKSKQGRKEKDRLRA